VAAYNRVLYPINVVNRQYASMISRPAVIRYDPYTQTMVALDNKDAIHDASRTLMADYHCLQRALTKVSYVTTA